jgi:hypothetical protein
VDYGPDDPYLFIPASASSSAAPLACHGFYAPHHVTGSSSEKCPAQSRNRTRHACMSTNDPAITGSGPLAQRVESCPSMRHDASLLAPFCTPPGPMAAPCATPDDFQMFPWSPVGSSTGAWGKPEAPCGLRPDKYRPWRPVIRACFDRSNRAYVQIVAAGVTTVRWARSAQTDIEPLRPRARPCHGIRLARCLRNMNRSLEDINTHAFPPASLGVPSTGML